MKKFLVFSVMLAFVANTMMSCGWSRAAKGGAIGAAGGAVVGGVIGKKAGNTAVGAILGAAIGGAAGAYIGRYMDKQAEEMRRDLEGARVERVGEGIKITFASGILFDVDRAELRPEGEQNLNNLADILQKYPDTEILIEGHTDSDASEEYNMDLSRRRANSASFELGRNGVDASRFTITAYGETQPVADNSTADGKQANRRVEIAIWANDKLKKAAQEQS